MHIRNMKIAPLAAQSLLAFAALTVASANVQAQTVTQGPSSSRTPYLVPAYSSGSIVRSITSIATATDLVPLTGSPTTAFEFGGIIDGLGAYDNGNGTVTILACFELGTTSGVVRRHGARGAYVTDCDDRQVLDLSMGFGAMLVGHLNPAVVAKVKEFLDDIGTLFVTPSPVSTEVAERFKERFGLDMLRFTNSGTEAVEAVTMA